MSTKADLCSTRCEIVDLYRYEQALLPALPFFPREMIIRIIAPYCVSTRKEEEDAKMKSAEWLRLTGSKTPQRFCEIALETALFRMVMLPEPPPGYEVCAVVRFHEARHRLSNLIRINSLSVLHLPASHTEADQKAIQDQLIVHSKCFYTTDRPFSEPHK